MTPEQRKKLVEDMVLSFLDHLPELPFSAEDVMENNSTNGIQAALAVAEQRIRDDALEEVAVVLDEFGKWSNNPHNVDAAKTVAEIIRAMKGTPNE